MATGNIKLPLSSFGFPYLCDFIKMLYTGLKIVSDGVDDNAAEISALTNEIINGEVTASCVTRGGEVITTQDGDELKAVKFL